MESGYQAGVWAVPRSQVGGLEVRAQQLAGMPCLFYVSSSQIWGDGFFCGPGVILSDPSDEFAKEHLDLFPEGRDWCQGFRLRPLSPDVAPEHTMKAEAIRKLSLVRGNYSQDLHLAGRCVFLPCVFPLEDCRAILAATGANADAFEVWESAGSARFWRL